MPLVCNALLLCRHLLSELARTYSQTCSEDRCVLAPEVLLMLLTLLTLLLPLPLPLPLLLLLLLSCRPYSQQPPGCVRHACRAGAGHVDRLPQQHGAVCCRLPHHRRHL
jgi:hypothetical protein